MSSSPTQESVWDYPRPPRLEPTSQRVQIWFNQVMIADTCRAQRVLETSHPPTYYLPPDDVQMQYLIPSPRQSFCEWKGVAAYYSVEVNEQRAENAAWAYPSPTLNFEPIRDYLAFYPSRMALCKVDGETVEAQPGDFYGGWITANIVGPFKGSPGTLGW